MITKFRRNTTKFQARKVWVSFGIFMILLPFMDDCQIVCLQSTNRFCYNIAVSRVQLSIRPEVPLYFTWHVGALSKKLISYSEKTGIQLLTQKAAREHPITESFDFSNCDSCQIDKDSLFLAEFGFNKCRILSKNDNNMEVFTSRPTAAPPTPSDDRLENYSMCCAIDAKFIYVTGGLTENLISKADCHRYDIGGDQWQDLPDMHHIRRNHSGCQL